MWRRASSSARAVLQLGAALHANRVGPPEAWTQLIGIYPWYDLPPEKRYLARGVLAGCVDHLLQASGVRAMFGWSGSPTLHFSTYSLPGALALGLALAVARSDGLAFCSACGSAYIPRRKPVDGKRRYCEECSSKGIPERDASRDWRQKARSARSG